MNPAPPVTRIRTVQRTAVGEKKSTERTGLHDRRNGSNKISFFRKIFIFRISLRYTELFRRSRRRMATEVDAEDGRIYLSKSLREKFGHRFELVDRGDRLVLLPVDENPLEALREGFA